MNPREFLAKRKAHLIFAGALLFVLAFNITIGFTAGQTFLGATWRAISEIRPMDYLMFALFGYACAVHRPKDDWDSSFITLNLSRSNNQK
ncbi:MAG: hypothetical protein ACRD6N_10395 [Pyrinomonadaceae bacterium]